MRCKGNELPEQRKRSESLEGILNRKVTIDTDIMDFFLIAGWRKWYWVNPIYEKAESNLKKNIENYLKSKNDNLNRSDKIKEALFIGSVVNQYPDKIKTIYDLKQKIESEGIRMRSMGYAGLAYFNKELLKYGLEEIRVGGKKETSKFLKKYGLKKIGK